MSLSNEQKAALISELTTDPAGLGYAGKTASEILALLTAKNRSVKRRTILASEIVAEIVHTEYEALTQEKRDYIRLIMSVPTPINLENSRIQDGLVGATGAFPNGSLTRANLVAYRNELVDRIEELNRSGSIQSRLVTPNIHQLELVMADAGM